METSTLQRVEKFVQYSVLEKQIVTELDSPAPGLTSQIASRTRSLRFLFITRKSPRVLREYKNRFYWKE